MKRNEARNWIWAHSKKELPLMVLLTIGNALFSVCAVSMALFAKYIIDAAQLGERTQLLRNAAWLLGVILLQQLLRILNKSLEIRISGRLEMHYKRRLFDAILQKDYSAVGAFHSGELLTRLTSDVAIVSDGISALLPSLASMLTRLVCAFAVILSLDWRFAVLLACAGALLFLGTRVFRGKIKALHKTVQESDGRLRAFLQESLESLLAIQVFGVQEKVGEQADARQMENYTAKIRRNRWSIFANTGFSAVFAFGFLLALVWSGLRLCAGSITFGTLTALLQLVNQVQVPISGLSGVVPKYYAMLSSAERLMEIEALPDDAPVNTPAQTMKSLADFSGIRFTDVSFAYGKTPVFDHADFTIPKNAFTVISGVSGVGKSTLFKLLLGVLAPQTGKVEICMGETACAADKTTRPLFAYVPQGNLLFSGTIRDNICFIREDATQAQIAEAARISCADRFIEELPAGLDTVLGEGGRGLSEGQIQRLALARAVLTDAPVLLLDEATSALDEATERQVLENLRALPDKTCILISHKKAAFSVCDLEIEITNGQATAHRTA